VVPLIGRETDVAESVELAAMRLAPFWQERRPASSQSASPRYHEGPGILDWQLTA
jgi:hypothetical protein